MGELGLTETFRNLQNMSLGDKCAIKNQEHFFIHQSTYFTMK